MRIHKEFLVDDINFKTFEPIANAEVFRAKFDEYSTSPIMYKFYKKEIWEEAEALLIELNLNYSGGYGIELETEEEVKSYPAFVFAPHSDYNLVKKNGNIWNVASKIKSYLIFQDISTDEIYISKKILNFFKEHAPSIKAELIETKSKGIGEFYRLSNFVIMRNPIICGNINSTIYELTVKDLFDLHNHNGLQTFSDEGKREIILNKISMSDSLLFESEIYKTPSKLIVSGEFVYLFLKEFGNKEDFFTPLTMDLI